MNTWIKTLSGSLLAGALVMGAATLPAAAADPEPDDPPTRTTKQTGQTVGEWTPTFFAIGVASAPEDDARGDGDSGQQMISTLQNLGVRSAYASTAGLLDGWPDGTFRPVQPINRDAQLSTAAVGPGRVDDSGNRIPVG